MLDSSLLKHGVCTGKSLIDSRAKLTKQVLFKKDFPAQTECSYNNVPLQLQYPFSS